MIHITKSVATDFVPDGQYRIHNLAQGQCSSLSIAYDKAALAPPQHTQRQFWNITNFPELPNFIQITASAFGWHLTMTIKEISVSFSSPWNSAHKLQPPGNQWYELKSDPRFPKSYQLLPTSTDLKGLCVGMRNFLFAPEAVPENDTDAKNYWVFEPVENMETVIQGSSSYPAAAKKVYLAGLPIVSSQGVPDDGLFQAYFVGKSMISEPIISSRVPVLIEKGFEIIILSVGEDIANLSFTTARGKAATPESPYLVVSEENLLCYANDSNFGEDIFVKYLAISLLNLLLIEDDPELMLNLNGLFENANKLEKWHDTIAGNSPEDYFSEAVQIWFEVNGYSDTPDGMHNAVKSRIDLEKYDPGLYDFVGRFFTARLRKCSCH